MQIIILNRINYINLKKNKIKVLINKNKYYQKKINLSKNINNMNKMKKFFSLINS